MRKRKKQTPVINTCHKKKDTEMTNLSMAEDLLQIMSLEGIARSFDY